MSAKFSHQNKSPKSNFFLLSLFYKEDFKVTTNEKFVIYVNETQVSILDTKTNEDEGENLELFGVDCETTENALYLAEELYNLVRLLNEQDKELEYDVV